MPVSDILGFIPLISQLVIQVTQSTFMLWLVLGGGWRYILRTFEFEVDQFLIKYIAAFYDYFQKFITLEVFNDKVLDELVRNLYVFIGVIMVFRLIMMILKYLINPDLTSDAKLGVNSLIKRVIVGLVGILFLPIIFDLALELQQAIFADNLIQQIIVPKGYLSKVQEVQQKGGKCIGTYIQAGFINPNSNATQADRDAYEKGVKQCDLQPIDHRLNDGAGIFTTDEAKFHFDYVYIVSTLVLGYALMQMAKYCIDMATRGFRMLLYKLIAPVAMIEYMIKGPDDGVFKQWKQAIISTYCLIFIRVLALWFVIFVMALMQDTSSQYTVGSLLAEDDHLLRAIIIVALLGFMMDLPKLIGSIFGLDLEQSGNAEGIFKSITGIVKGAATGGLAITGAAVGGLASAGMNVAQSGVKGVMNGKPFGESILNDSKMHERLAKSGQAQRKALFGSVPFMKDFYGGLSSSYTAGQIGAGIDAGRDKQKEDETKKAEEARHAADSAALQSMESALWGGNRKKSNKGSVDGVVDAGESTNGVLAKQSIAIGNDIAFKAGGEAVHADGSHALDVSVADSDLQANRNIRTAVNNQYSTVAGGELRDAGGIDGLQPVQSTTIDTQDSVLAHHRTVRNIESETVGGDVVDISTGAVTGNIDRSESIAGKIDTDVNLQRNMNAHVMGGETVDVSTGAVTGTIDQKNSISGKIDTEVNLQRNLNAHIAGGETVDVDTGAVTGNIDKKESISGQIQTDVNLQRNLNAHVMGGDTVDVDTGEVTGSVDQENSIEGRLNTNVNIAHNINSTLSGGTKVDETTGEETGEEVSEDQSISKNIRKAVNVATNISSKLTGGETVDEDTGEANGNIEEEDSIAGKIDAKNDSEDE